MEFTQDQIAAIIGTKEMEIIALRMEVAALTHKLKEKDDAGRPDAGAGSLSVVENRAA
jgi:hypothetical protein